MKNDYYVYIHKTLNGTSFYIGKGRLKRAWNKSRRSKEWEEVSSQGYLVEIYKENLSEKDALIIENDLISNTENLVNKRILKSVEFDDYKEYFLYDPDSPSGLSRIKGVRSGRGKGYEQGSLGPCGRKRTRSCGGQSWVVEFKNRTAQVHRIVWQLFNGAIPDGFVVDHIDGNSLNNKISNLRLITQAENAKNSKKSKDNTSGVTGVSFFIAEKGKYSYWCATISNIDGNQAKKFFSICKLGNEEAFRLACEWRTEQIRLLNEQGAGYTERHGT